MRPSAEMKSAETGFPKSGGRAQTELREVSVVVIHELVGRQGWHFANQLVEQLILKQAVDDDVWEGLGGPVFCGHLLKTLRDHDFVVQQRQDVDNVAVCHMRRR
jgi:hypothetical protein